MEDVRRIALALPGVTEGSKQLAFEVPVKGKPKGFCWSWKQRVHPKKPRVERLDVLAVRVIDEEDKQALLLSDPAVFFTEPHYNGFPAVLVRLHEVSLFQLEELILDAWRCLASPSR